MAKLAWTMLCRRSVVDRDDNSLSIFEVVEEATITLKSEPPMTDGQRDRVVIPNPIQILSLWMRDHREVPEEFISRVLICSPSAKVLHSQEVPVDLSGFQRSRQRINLKPGIPYVGPGRYEYKVQLKRKNWRTVGTAYMDIREETDIEIVH